MTTLPALNMRLMNWLGGLIPAVDDDPPPQPPRSLLPFFRWALAGTAPTLVVAGVVSAIAGGAEVFAAMLLGIVIDAAEASAPRRLRPLRRLSGRGDQP